VTSIDKAAWQKELELHSELFTAAGLPPAQGAERHQGDDRKASGGLSRPTQQKATGTRWLFFGHAAPEVRLFVPGRRPLSGVARVAARALAAALAAAFWRRCSALARAIWRDQASSAITRGRTIQAIQLRETMVDMTGLQLN
jgi:hypothetical protein